MVLRLFFLIFQVIPIQRAQMRVRLVIPGKDAKKIKEKFVAQINIEKEEHTPELCIVSNIYFLD